MKTSCLIVTTLFFGIFGIQADPVSTGANQPSVPAPTAHRVVERGANHKVWQWETYEQGRNGKTVTHVHKYTELATGMHYWSNGQWVESQEQIQTYSQGAIAQQGQYQVIFANNLNSAGSIDLQTPDGKRLRSNILGLMYHDTANGNAVLIAQVQDSQGELISTNQVLYTNAFTGVNADVRYTYKKGSFEQDVILREQPPTPESYGLNSQTTEIEVMTEFIDPPTETIKEHEGQNAEIDQDISWGVMRIGRGKAFDLGQQQNPAKWMSVIRQYETVNGRKILLEKVPLKNIQARLQTLPLQSSIKSKLPAIVSKQPSLPKTPLAQVDKKPMKLAAALPSNKGYVLDYVLLDTDQDDITFQGDITYLISGGVNIDGVATFEGGTVVKYGTDTNNESVIQFWDALVCNTGPYRPAIFTSQNDDSVGENISVSGTPMDFFQAIAEGGADGDQLQYVRISYADYGVHTYNINMSDSQFINCQYPIDDEWGTCNLTNVLMVNSGTAFYGTEYNVNAFQLTIDGCTNNELSGDWEGSGLSSAVFTNSLLVNVGSDGDAAITTNYTARLTTNSTNVFLTVGAGSHYLAVGSPYRNAGTTNIDPGVLADIATKTTYPPIVYANETVPVGTLSPQAQRDTDIPDLGYHYDPLDYVFGGCDLFTNLTINAGTAIGWYEDYGDGNVYCSYQPYGISLNDGANLTATGTATQPCWIVATRAVQEGNGNWTDYGYLGGIIINGSGSGIAPQLNNNFTKWSTLANDGNHFRDNWAYGVVKACNTEFYSGSMNSYWGPQYFTNCLFFRVGIAFWDQIDAASFTFQNCTFYNGNLAMYRDGSQDPSFWDVENTAFDGTAILTQNDNFNGNTNYTLFNYNAYNYGNTNWQGYDFGVGMPCTNTLETVGPNDVTNILSFDWQSSWLGDFYLPTNSLLINAGSTTADQVGLYHFTTQTNQVKETNSIVDIGYHYVAVDTNGNPIDSNGDGIPDYLADANGNGIDDVGEIPWNLPLTNLLLWLRADAGVTNSGGAISVWSDQSGHGNNATQTSGVNQPNLVTNVLNGFPVVRFNGTNSYFSLPNFMSTATGAEVFVVVKAAVTNTPYSSLWQIGSGAGDNDGYPCSDGSIGEDFGSTVIQPVGIPNQPLTQFNVYEASSVSTNWAAWLNGAPIYQTTNNAVGFTTTPSLGYYYEAIPYGPIRTAYFWGDMAEVLIFNRSLTSSERLNVDAYLDEKYALTPPVPATPSNLVATAVSPTQIGLTWDETATWNLSVVSIERSTSSNGAFSVVAQLANATSYIDTNLTAGTTYFYRLRAISWTQQLSAYSGVASVTTPSIGADLPFGSLALWLKADAGLVQGSTNTPVSLWADQSGTGDNATQSSSGNQPSWVPGAIGDRPVVRFNASNGCYLNLSNFLGNTATAAEAFVVLKVVTNTFISPVIWQMGNDVGLDGGGQYPSSYDGNIREDFGSDILRTEGIPTQPLTQYHLYEVASQNNSYTAWINGAVQFQTNYNVIGFRTLATLGTARVNSNDQWINTYFNGDMAEVLIFNRALASDEEKTVGSYLVSKYNLSLTAVNNSTSSVPTGLTASGIAPYKLNLLWNRTSTNESGFRIERKLGTGGVYQEIGSTAAGVTNFVDTTANATNQYFYRVTSFNYFGESGASSEISPPTVQLTNWPANIFEKTTNVLSARASDAVGTVSNVQFFADYTPVGTAFSAPYTINWFSTFEGACTLSALATDSLGNSQFSSAINVTVYLDSNGDGTSDIAQVSSGNDPLNPWTPTGSSTNAPSITLLIPTNAVIVP